MEVTRGGEQYLVAHAKVDQPERYTVLTIVPVSEALRPVERLKTLIANGGWADVSAQAENQA